MVTSCANSNDENKGNKCSGFISELQMIASDNKKLAVIPLTGCSSCIDKSIAFYNENETGDVQFVFTRITDHKLLKRQLIDDSNCYIDMDNKLNSFNCISIYPILISLETNKVIQIDLSVDFGDALKRL